MLDRLLLKRTRPPGGPDAAGESLRSHVFPRFLKWLSGRDRPAVLDLGRLSGANIEIFARLGCRVQVEDLLTAVEERLRVEAASLQGAEPMTASPLPRIEDAAAAPAAAAAPPSAATNGSTPQNGSRSAHPAAPPNGSTPAASNGAQLAAPNGSAHPNGSAPGNGGGPVHGAAPAAGTPAAGRPTRHIVLPPRVFGTSPVVGGPQAGANGGRNLYAPRPAPLTLPLPTSFSYPSESFDAIVGWDLFNYYDPEAAKRLGPDVVRLLRPGGQVFATFHARREDAPDGPARHRIVDESHLQVEAHAGPPMARHLYQNRDIEKLFSGLKIVELYFLRHGVREMLLEKRARSAPPAIGGPARPRPRFRIE